MHHNINFLCNTYDLEIKDPNFIVVTELEDKEGYHSKAYMFIRRFNRGKIDRPMLDI